MIESVARFITEKLKLQVNEHKSAVARLWKRMCPVFTGMIGYFGPVRCWEAAVCDLEALAVAAGMPMSIPQRQRIIGTSRPGRRIRASVALAVSGSPNR